MTNIESYEWLKQKIDEYRACGSHSNFFFMAQKIQALIDDGRLSFQETGRNLLLFEREPEFYRMYYFWSDMESVTNIKADLPVVIEFPYREHYSDNQVLEAEYIRRLGFEIARRSRIMSAKTQDVILLMSASDSNITIRPARQDERDQITGLLDSSFNKYFSFLPDKTELMRLIDEKRILAIYYENALAGVIDVELRGRSNWIWHFAVSPEYRHKGLGKTLLGYVIRRYRDEVKEFMLWVDTDNEAAVSLYKKAGYTFSAKGADEYILKCKGDFEK